MINRKIHEHESRRIANIMGDSSACAAALRRADEYIAEGREVEFAIVGETVVVIASPADVEGGEE